MATDDNTHPDPAEANAEAAPAGADTPNLESATSAADASPAVTAAPEPQPAQAESAEPQPTAAEAPATPEVTAREPAASVEDASGAPEAAAPNADAPAPAPAATSEAQPSEPEGDGTGNGTDSDTAASAESVPPGDDGATASEAPPGDGEGEGDEDRPKKKRRRRKKKKGAEGSTEGSQRPGRPSSDRAPFHVGEEVFGKVTAVLETAIMIDLSGKALAIFDRGEMEPDDLVPNEGDRFVARVHNDGARGGLVVLTRKPLREEEAKPRVEQAAKDGGLIEGLVTGAIKGGVEVDIDGLRAFAPASGMDLHPAHANFTALLGQRMQFKVLQFKNAGRDVVVTRRPMLEAEAHERRKHALTTLTEGQVLKGVVRTVVEWGAFVALPNAENLEGLIHISEASHDPRARIAELFKPGDQFEVQITKIDDKGKIWLSRKALVEDPWAEARQKYAPRSRLKGKVARVEPFGVFVELEEGLDGLIHVADLSFDRVENPEEVVKVGEEIEVVVHHFDQRNKKIALHPAPPPERDEEPVQKVQRGSTVKVQIVKAEGPGVVCRVLGATGRAARGFLPAGQTGTTRGTDLRKHFRAGDVIDVKVIDVDPRRGEPKLSIRGLREDEERRAHREYRQKLKAEASFGTLGDLLKQKLNLEKPGDD